MKNIKLFENYILDRILDKISFSGKNSLTEYEKEYLRTISEDPNKNKEMSKDIDNRRNRYQSTLNYDPREDEEGLEYFDELANLIGDESGGIRNMNDETYNDNKWNIIWDELDDEDHKSFYTTYNIPIEIADSSWDDMPEQMKNQFINWFNDKF